MALSRMNQWDFQKTGKIFQVVSILVPLVMELIRVSTEVDVPGLKTTERFQKCVIESEGLNTTSASISLPLPVTVEFTLRLLPHSMVSAIYYIDLAITLVIGSNLLETYLYFKIFESIKR